MRTAFVLILVCIAFSANAQKANLKYEAAKATYDQLKIESMAISQQLTIMREAGVSAKDRKELAEQREELAKEISKAKKRYDRLKPQKKQSNGSNIKLPRTKTCGDAHRAQKQANRNGGIVF